MPFDEHNYEYVRDNSFAQKEHLLLIAGLKLFKETNEKTI